MPNRNSIMSSRAEEIYNSFFKSAEQDALSAFESSYQELLNKYDIRVELDLTLLNNQEKYRFYIDLLFFAYLSEGITKKIINAAITRKNKGIPALKEQDEQEQLQHCFDHLRLWQNNQIGDEDTVTEQARHTVCRALLAYYTRIQVGLENE